LPAVPDRVRGISIPAGGSGAVALPIAFVSVPEKIAIWFDAKDHSTSAWHEVQKALSHGARPPTALAALLAVGVAAVVTTAPALAQEKMTTPTPAEKKLNILFIMGDDIGWMQPSIYHEGLAVFLADEGAILDAILLGAVAGVPHRAVG
jgi:hypothetical protein